MLSGCSPVFSLHYGGQRPLAIYRYPLKVKVLVAQLGPTLFDSMDYSLPGSGSWNSPGKNTGVDSHSLLLHFYCCFKNSTEIVVYTYFFSIKNR